MGRQHVCVFVVLPVKTEMVFQVILCWAYSSGNGWTFLVVGIASDSYSP